jgi:hypothetical protein
MGASFCVSAVTANGSGNRPLCDERQPDGKEVVLADSEPRLTCKYMSQNRPASAKIIQHSEGLGAPNADHVRVRAQELAIINGRAEYNEEDWRDAKRELHGGHATPADDGEMEMEAIVSGHDMVAGSLGHHVENVSSSESENLGEELVAEGMDEAEHEQMLLARTEVEPEDDEEE